ncbi:unnamed protein product [Candida verbasci]|uniref:Ribosomal protein L10 n=1 Tax=Candida verbasci TaxID=1227364 RepID=A0A9W4XEC1_9ASCO|nr:unnamed protein product [Candida verbasci]
MISRIWQHRPIRSFSTTTRYLNEFIPTTQEHHDFLARNTEKPLFSRKTYLIDYYKHLNDSNQILLFLHHNNLNKPDTDKFRHEISKIGGKLNYINNSIYKTYLKSQFEKDPAEKGISFKNQNVDHPLLPLLNGPTCIISIKETNPQIITSLIKLLKSAHEKLILIGGRIENNIMNIDDINKFKDLPTKENLQGQLLGLLTMLSGTGLVQTLSTPSQMLYLTMYQRKDDIEKQE